MLYEPYTPVRVIAWTPEEEEDILEFDELSMSRGTVIPDESPCILFGRFKKGNEVRPILLRQRNGCWILQIEVKTTEDRLNSAKRYSWKDVSPEMRCFEGDLKFVLPELFADIVEEKWNRIPAIEYSLLKLIDLFIESYLNQESELTRRTNLYERLRTRVQGQGGRRIASSEFPSFKKRSELEHFKEAVRRFESALERLGPPSP